MEALEGADPKAVGLLLTCTLSEFEIKIPIQLEKWEFAKLAELMEKIGGFWVKTRQAFVVTTAVPVPELLGLEINLGEDDSDST